MLKLSLAVTAVSSVLVTLATGAIAQKNPPEMPLAIICWSAQSKSWRVGNLSNIQEDGTATYVTASGELSSTIDAKGVAVPPFNRPASDLDCFGKTLDELRAMGRLLEFQRTR